MSNPNFGGPVYPIADMAKTQCHGMTLREYYAGLAMAACIAHEWTSSEDRVARWAVAYADALIAALDSIPTPTESTP